MPGETRLATLHLSMSDATGDSAIVEYIGGRQVIHHGRQYQVMTNSPNFDEQLALNEYWKQIGGTVLLPGTNRAADRFARASFYVNAIPKDEDPNTALASVFSVIRNISVPYGVNPPEEPNISSTRWRIVADHSAPALFLRVGADAERIPGVDLKGIDFSAEARKVRMLDLGPNQDHTYAGDATKAFREGAGIPVPGAVGEAGQWTASRRGRRRAPPTALLARSHRASRAPPIRGRSESR